MQIHADSIARVETAPGSTSPDSSAPNLTPGRGLRARLRRTVLLSATILAPRLAADKLARRYLTSDQAVLDRLAGRSHRFEIVDLGQDCFVLRSRFRGNAADAPRVLIAPGHDGHIRQFTRVVRALQKRGATVDMLIYPGHGHAKRRVCSLGDIVDAICRATQSEGPYAGIVAHCVAANAMFHALERGISAPRMTLISVPLDLPGLIRLGGRQYGLSGRCLDQFVDRVSALGAPCPIDRPWLPVAETRDEDLLIVQSRNDYAAPVEKARPLAAAWPGAQMEEYDHGGHNGILNVTSAINRIAEFMVPDRP
ncbi:alpha/beta hydrolase [Mameliella alba]|uniref:alpha/beta hydrolase n=1 Tax=Mameliella alba TaxID=561184 RepID=UPI0014303F7C|nr:alpha/beta hydrolase [Mameliella alba]